MCLLVGAGTPKEFLARPSGCLLLLATAYGAVIVMLIAATETEVMLLAVRLQPDPNP
jgi:hypothetical protein